MCPQWTTDVVPKHRRKRRMLMPKSAIRLTWARLLDAGVRLQPAVWLDELVMYQPMATVMGYKTEVFL
jgi:hypothetical protein